MKNFYQNLENFQQYYRAQWQQRVRLQLLDQQYPRFQAESKKTARTKIARAQNLNEMNE